jgi:hypothetical protein
MKIKFFRLASCLLLILLLVMSFVFLTKIAKPIDSVQAESKILNEMALSQTVNSEIKSAMSVHNRHIHTLMAFPNVVGAGVGLTETGKASIVVFLKDRTKPKMLPDNLEGFPVIEEVTGEFFPMKLKAEAITSKINTTQRFPRPVPIGVSTGNVLECSAGTIGARVKDSAGNVYALSNNHVYALENTAPIGSKVVQPGLYDTGCSFSEENVIGTLSAFEPIVFSQFADNVIDAAVAISSTALLNNSTPADGYGKPKSTIVQPVLRQSVQKYGRTTKLTIGRITAINATINVSYSSGTARFVNQIVVRSSRPFIKPGDSGSLLVTYPNRNPVGLLFAGNSSGTYAMANPIDAVLNRFGVTIDGD